MKLAVVGATHGVGRKVVERALARGHEVWALARNPAALAIADERLHVVAGDALDPAGVAALLAEKEAVISALGSRDRHSKVRSAGTRNLIAAAVEAGVKRIAVVSSIGVADSRDQARRSSLLFRCFATLFLGPIFADLAVMEEAVRKSALEWTIARPTGLRDRPPSGDVACVIDGSKVRSMSISRTDVADFLLDAVESGKWARQAVTITN